jgi:hypothetical protein
MAENPKRGQGPLRAVTPLTSTMRNTMMVMMMVVVVVNNFRLDIWQMNPSKWQNMDLLVGLLLPYISIFSLNISRH